MAKNNLSPLETKHLVLTGLGLLCPIPGIGELIATIGLYPVVRATEFFGDTHPTNFAATLAVTTLTRFGLIYDGPLRPAYDLTMDLLSKLS
jgi:hypothetical protein